MHRRPPSPGEWMMTRLCWTMTGVFLGLALGVELVNWFLGWWFLDWDGAFWTILITPTVGGAIGLWLDIRSAREWNLFKRPEGQQDQQIGAPPGRVSRRPRRWSRFERSQDQRRPDR